MTISNGATRIGIETPGIRLKNKFSKTAKAGVAPGYERGVLKVCDELIRQVWLRNGDGAGSMLSWKKLVICRGIFRSYAQVQPTSQRSIQLW